MGILAGPAGFSVITQHEEIELLASVGISLLLFVVGNEPLIGPGHVAVFIFAAVMAIAGYALFGSKREVFASKTLIVGGGIVFPVVTLSALLVYSLVRAAALHPEEPDALRVVGAGGRELLRALRAAPLVTGVAILSLALVRSSSAGERDASRHLGTSEGLSQTAVFAIAAAAVEMLPGWAREELCLPALPGVVARPAGSAITPSDSPWRRPHQVSCSLPLSSSNRGGTSGRYPSRALATAGCRYGSAPATATQPASGRDSPPIRRSSVDLPAPERPMMPTIWPSGISRSISQQATLSPNRRVTLVSLSIVRPPPDP